MRTLAWLLGLGVALPGPASVAFAQEPTPDKPAVPQEVYTFYGLRKLEQDPNVTDEKKLEEWQAFIERATDQIGYAKKAVDRWKNAAKVRVVEAAKKADRDSELSPREKAERWRDVVRLYPKSAEVQRARRRAAHWQAEETKRLAEAAEAVEKDRRPKVERIKAWLEVLAWTDAGPEARAAIKRIGDLQTQLYDEANSVDAIARVDLKTKLEAWRDVLDGRPDAKMRARAETRVAELEAELQASARRDAPAPSPETN